METAMTGRKGQTVFNVPAPVCDFSAGNTSPQNVVGNLNLPGGTILAGFLFQNRYNNCATCWLPGDA